ncbi:uncharacterized protein LOC125488915 [Plutella xylostella]|uniref:uncharacterized protein LOC125488915 n=1 Tax=Plutella xylostella TaxID=51655 RepID=UPI002032C91F|nr:uncharacterized protein LOC125488915 [Plutella xylostella]
MSKLTRTPPQINISMSASNPDLPTSENLRCDKRRRLSGDERDSSTSMQCELQKLFASLELKLLHRIETIEKDVREIKCMSTSSQETNQAIEKSISFVTNQLTALEDKIDKLEDNRKVISKEISLLDSKCENMERIMRKSCIEIRNVPKIKNEKLNDLFNMIHTLSDKLGLKLGNSDLRDVYRINNKANKDVSSVIFEVSNTLLKSCFLESAKKWNRSGSDQLNSTHLGLTGNVTPIYISECLTARAKRIHYLARDFAKTHSYDFCWTSNGLVYLRKKSGDPYILIAHEGKLEELK